jgi:hypothetical protein
VSISWKRPRPAPAEAFGDMLGDVARRTGAMRDDRLAGFLEMVYEIHQPLVRAALRTGRGRRRLFSAGLAVVPVLAFGAALLMGLFPAAAPWAAWLTGLFVCLWPTACFLGAGLAAGAAVVDERERGTAIQLVLTPIGKRPIAASKVLPAAWTFLPAALAGLPVCVLAGSSAPFLADGWIPVALPWPLRFLQLTGGVEPPEPALMALVSGALMCASDLALVWAAAHWGAAYGVRLGRLPLVAGALAWRACLTGFYMLALLLTAVAACGLVGFTVGMFVGLFHPAAGVALVVAAGAWVFLRYWRRYFLVWPVQAVLVEFTHFDELAQDDHQARPLRGWEILAPYGERT